MRTPIHLAVQKNLLDMVKLLISHGAKVEVRDNVSYKRTAPNMCNLLVVFHLSYVLELQYGNILEGPEL